MSFESAQSFVSQMKGDLDLRKNCMNTQDSKSLWKLMKTKGFNFDEHELVKAMAECMSEMSKSPSTEMDDKIKTLIALGAATAANCIPCFEHIFLQACSLGITPVQIQEAVDVAVKVKTGASIAIKDTIKEIMDSEKTPKEQDCCEKAASACCQ
ncbi:MAG: Nif11-like leader peptide family natural product precursor [Desulfobacteraceae bacterium]|nr:Nif11-like leader peptide family natural product precursor [Desulfobacteraceae bacterium]